MSPVLNCGLHVVQSYANELMLCMLSSVGEDTQSPGYQRMEQLVAAHVSHTFP